MPVEVLPLLVHFEDGSAVPEMQGTPPLPQHHEIRYIWTLR